MNIWKIKETTARRIWTLLLAVCTVLGCIPIVSLTASAQVIGNGYTVSTGNTIGSNLLGSANNSTDTGTTGTGDSGSSSATDGSDGNSATVECTHQYENGICTECGAYQEPGTDILGTYKIANAGNLYWFAAQVNSGNTGINAILTADITVNENVLGSGNLTNGTNTLRRWTPIGDGSNNYTGSFDGNGKTISGLYYYNGTPSDDNAYYVGLFGYVKGGASIEKVGLIDSYFCVNETASGTTGVYLGGIVAYAYQRVTISGCHSGAVLYVNHYSDAKIGGIVGYVKTIQVGKASIEVRDCYNTGDLFGYSGDASGGNTLGGIVGYANSCDNITVSGCYNTGTLSGGMNSNVGGTVGKIAADDSITVSDCYNTGKLTGDSASSNVGGAVGMIVGGGGWSTISNCYNAGELSGGNCGGVAGNASAMSRGSIAVNNCYFTNTEQDALGKSSTVGSISSISVDDKTGSVTADAVASGKVVYLLNNERTPSVWKQGKDSPAFKGDEVGYNSESDSYVLSHTYVDGACNVCGVICAHGTVEDERCTICGCTYAAEVKFAKATKKYFTVSEAFSAVINDATITLLRDATIQSTIEISNKNANITLIGGEYTLSAECTIFKITKGTLTVQSGKYITTGGNVFYVSGVASVPGSSSSGSGSEGAITTPDIGKVDVSTDIPGISTGDITVDIPGIGTTTTATDSGTVKIVDGTFTSNGHTVCIARDTTSSMDESGTLTTYTEKGKAEIGGGVFTSTGGYAIYVGTESIGSPYWGGELVVSGGEFKGGLYIVKMAVGDDISVTLSGGSFDRIDYSKKADILQQYYAYFTKDASGEYTVPTAATDVGTNAVQIKLCTHVYTKADGKCDICGKACDHPAWSSATGACATCGYGHVHSAYDADGFCTVCHGGYQPCEGKGTDKEPYLIKNAGNLYWFAAQVNSGNTSINGKLTADIVVNKNLLNSLTFDENGNVTNGDQFRMWTPIGNGSNQYTGTFDGANHTVSGLYYNGSDSYVGLFGYIVGGANIKNVGVIDNYFHVSHLNGAKVGGVVGCIDGAYQNKAVMEGCYHAGCIYVSLSSAYWGHVGGVAGYIWNDVDIKNCYNTGSVTGDGGSSSYFGGVIGHIWAEGGSVTVEKCYNAGSVSGSAAEFGDIVGDIEVTHATANVKNCYYLSSSVNKAYNYEPNEDMSGYATFDDICAMSEAEFASGAVAWLLNGSTSTGVWKQTIGTDTSPNFTGGTVYQVYECDGSTISDSVYANSTGKKLPHVNVNGTCSGCDQALVATVTVGETTDYYPTLNEAFAAASGKTATIALLCNAAITSTIEIGDSNTNITLVGGTHTVSATGTMFSITAGTLTIKSGKYTTTSGNVIDVSGTVTDPTTSSGSGSSSGDITYAPDIGGTTIATTTVGTVNVEGGSFTSESGYALYVGVVSSGNASIEGSAIAQGIANITGGTFSGSEYAVYVGAAGATIGGTCGKLNIGGGTFGKLHVAGIPKNNVVLSGGTFAGITLATGAPSLALKSGYAFYTADDGGAYTVLTVGTAVTGKAVAVKLCTHVYTKADGKCDICGYNCPHDVYENGFCTACGAYEPCEGEGTAANPYLIKNEGNLYWFAQYVNGQNKAGAAGQTASGDAKLTADIIVNADVLNADGTPNTGTFRAWTPIGSDGNRYIGTFDGDGHTISGLYYNGDDQHVGLFGYLTNGATIQNVIVTDSYFGCTKNSLVYVGGLAGYADAQTDTLTIQNCVFRGTIARSGGDGHAGGLVGYLYVTTGEITVRNCSFDGKVGASGGNAYAGGFAGSISMSDSGGKCTIEICCATGNVTASGSNTYAGGLVGHASTNGTLTVTNCYATVSVTANATQYDAYAGGLVGSARAQAGAISVSNCYAVGTVGASTGGSTTGEFPAEVFQGVVGYAKTGVGAGIIALTNCYYPVVEGLQGVGNDATATGVTAMTDAQFASGEVTWLLNGRASEGTQIDRLSWYQTLGAGGDRYPTLDMTHGTVYFLEQSDTYGNTLDIISVTVTWTSMAFTYTDGAWDPDRHDYKVGTWSAGEGNGTVTVENTGNVTITANFVYTTDRTDIGGSFTKSSFDLAEGTEDTTKLMLSGKPSERLNGLPIGKITITIAKKSE